MLQIIGGIIFLIGAFLWLGNVIGFFPTFTGAGWIGLFLGGIVFRAGSNSDDE